ncbi:unnamed protein product [Clonostachys byssicola]|uniref:Uncharacterized protein n=1 Tax=Clonostachys byssicola TaxID=160290 RepID=A0A9N9UR66_9HYPO|nr:unnamed protein product [Clonostachys byssicola]
MLVEMESLLSSVAPLAHTAREYLRRGGRLAKREEIVVNRKEEERLIYPRRASLGQACDEADEPRFKLRHRNVSEST